MVCLEANGEEEGARAHEVVVGVVVDIKDPSKLARAKIKVPMLETDPGLSQNARSPHAGGRPPR